jgi:hypothetical protein
MREGMMALDRPPEALKTIGELTGGRYGTKRVAAPAASMAPERSLREVLEDEPYTLRTLENLPGKRTVIPMSEIREQMRRPEVTKAEKDVLERVLSGQEGDSISAEDLVAGVRRETEPYGLAPKEYFGDQKFANYGLQNIDRVTGPPGEPLRGIRPDGTWGDLEERAVEGRTTVHRSPTLTSADNHFNDPNYFGHTRAFEENGIPHVVEIQSDLVQKAGKELGVEERTMLEQGNAAIDAQSLAIEKTMRSAPFRERDYAGIAAKLEELLPALEQANPDAVLLIGHYLKTNNVTRLLRGDTPEETVANTLRTLKTDWIGYGPDLRNDAAKAMSNALDDFNARLNVHRAENDAKLAERTVATAQRPMFKNWERRLIREELSRAATPQLNPEYESLRNRAKSALKYAKQIEDDYVAGGFNRTDKMIAAATAPFRKEAEEFAQRALEVEQYKPVPPVVRFADADTVAAVEGWPRKIEIIPGEVMAPELAGKRLMGSRAGTANDWVYTGNVGVDESGIWAAERYPIDVTGNQIGEPLWSTTGTSNLSEETINKLTRVSDKFEYPEHQGIYDRYKKEVANYLKSLGGKQVKDGKGHGWWEVPVDPKKAKRTQLFSMGGGAAAVAAGGAATYNSEEQ